MHLRPRGARRAAVAALALATVLPATPGAAADGPAGSNAATVERPAGDVRVGSVHDGSPVAASFSAAGEQPANDDFGDATDLSQALFRSEVVSGSTSLATLESGEPQGPVRLRRSVWFRVPKGIIGAFDANTTGSGFDTVLNVWAGYGLDSLELVTSNDDTSGTTSQVAFDVDDRRDYWLQLGSKGADGGTFKLHTGFTGRIQTAGLVSYHPGPLSNADGGMVLKADFYEDRGEAMAEFATAEGWQTHQAGDLDGDGVQSLYSYFPGPDGNGKGRWWQTNLDTGRLSRLTDFGTATGWQSHLMADMDGNGVDEIVSYYPGNGSWWLTQVRSDGSAAQRRFTSFGTREGWQTHRVADMDGDGRDEILSYFPGNGSWWETTVRADGVAVQRKLTTYGTRTGWAEHLVGDVTGDGTPELLSFHPGSGRWWQTDVSGTTSRQSILTVYGEGDGLGSADWGGHVLGDWDFDGKDDLVSFDMLTGKWWSTSTDGDKAGAREHVYTYTPGDGWQTHQFTPFG